jgi:DNA-binding transcriptional LysR family regulator
MQDKVPNAALSWDGVRFFLALCRSRSLGEAARRLGVDGSTVSRRLSSLEEELGSTLFERGRDGIIATEAAETLLPVAEEIEHGMARFAGRAESLERDVAGLVRLACPPDAAEVLIAPLLPELIERHPRLSLDLEAGSGLVDIARRAADIALRVVRPESGDLTATRLVSVEWTVAVTPELRRSVGTLRRWTDVPWIGWGGRFSDAPPARWHAKHVGAEPRLRSDSLRLQIALVVQGLGAALMPAASVDHYGLVPLKLSSDLKKDAAGWPRDELYMVTHRALRRVPRVRAVWEFLLEHIGR